MSFQKDKNIWIYHKSQNIKTEFRKNHKLIEKLTTETMLQTMLQNFVFQENILISDYSPIPNTFSKKFKQEKNFFIPIHCNWSLLTSTCISGRVAMVTFVLGTPAETPVPLGILTKTFKYHNFSLWTVEIRFNYLTETNWLLLSGMDALWLLWSLH